MGRSAWDARGCAAAALMASCLTVAASAQQASVPSALAGSTTSESTSQQPRASATQEASLGSQDPTGHPQASIGQLPVSVDRIREGLGREPAFRFDGMPVFSLTINERRPRYWDLQSPFLFKVEPRTSTTRWHDEFQAMVTPDEARLYSPMLSASETATIAATGMLFAGAASLLKAGFGEWQQGRREGKARAAVAEVDAALAAWALANAPK